MSDEIVKSVTACIGVVISYGASALMFWMYGLRIVPAVLLVAAGWFCVGMIHTAGCK